MDKLLAQITELKKETEKLTPFNPEFEQKFWQKFRLEFSYNSNHMEGSTLTYGHTELLLLFDKIGSDSYTLRELEEMKAHDAALRLVKEAALEPYYSITEKFIKELNQIILVRPFYKEAETYDGQPTRRLIEPGQYKKLPNNVRLENGETFYYASVTDTPVLMGELIDWIKSQEEKKELHPIQLAALVHYKFVRIHPFDDSNGRTSRLLMNYYLIKYGYAPIVIESKEKRNYLTALNRADTGDIDAFVDYILVLSLKWQEIFLKAIKGKSIEDEDDVDKEIHLLKKRITTSTENEKIHTKETFQKTCLESILPFLLIVFNKLSELNSVFLKNHVSFFSDNYGSGTLKNIDEGFKQIIKGIASNKFEANFSITFTYTYDGLAKHETIDFTTVSSFNINFHEKYYDISSSDLKKIFIKKFYYEKISDEESIKFSTLLLKEKLKMIHEKIGH
jgi:Fic family protein